MLQGGSWGFGIDGNAASLYRQVVEDPSLTCLGSEYALKVLDRAAIKKKIKRAAEMADGAFSGKLGKANQGGKLPKRVGIGCMRELHPFP